MRCRAVALCGLVMFVCAGCLLYTDPINMAPEVTITGPLTVQRGERVAFVADVTDDGVATTQGVTFAWAKAPTCPPALVEEQPRFTIGEVAASAEVRHDGKEPRFCVWVVAQDRHGAKRAAARDVEVHSWTLAIAPPSRVNPNETSMFSASIEGSLPVGKVLTYVWWKSAKCATPGRTPPASDLIASCSGQTCGIKPQDPSPFCVTVSATDAFGITEVAQHEVPALTNRAPQAIVETEATSFELFAVARLSAAKSMDPDGDKLTATWSVKRPDGQDAMTMPCAGAVLSKSTDSPVCVLLDQAGTYKVQLTVSDGAEMAMTAPLTLTVEDRPPCFAQTSPDYVRAPKIVSTSDEQTFTVTVDDDGDPVPAPADRPSMGRFAWFVGRKGDSLGSAGWTLPQFTLDRRRYNFRAGDDVLVRVVYVDRLGERTTAQTCTTDAYTCAARSDRPTCLQRITWEVYLR